MGVRLVAAGGPVEDGDAQLVAVDVHHLGGLSAVRRNRVEGSGGLLLENEGDRRAVGTDRRVDDLAVGLGQQRLLFHRASGDGCPNERVVGDAVERLLADVAERPERVSVVGLGLLAGGAGLAVADPAVSGPDGPGAVRRHDLLKVGVELRLLVVGHEEDPIGLVGRVETLGVE